MTKHMQSIYRQPWDMNFPWVKKVISLCAHHHVSFFAVRILDMINFRPPVIRCSVQKYFKTALFFLLSLWMQINSLRAQDLMQTSAIKPFPMAFYHMVSCCSAVCFIICLCWMARVSLGTVMNLL